MISLQKPQKLEDIFKVLKGNKQKQKQKTSTKNSISHILSFKNEGELKR